MRKIGMWTLFGVLLVMNGILLWQSYSLRKVLRTIAGDEAIISLIEGYPTDMRGVYTMPTIGKYFMPEELQPQPAPPLSMAIFMSSKSECGMNLAEFEVFKRLLPEFESRGQRIVAVCAPEDSLNMAIFLDSVEFEVPLAAVWSDQFNFNQMGISPKFMPFKVLYDSTYTAIYMRGGDNTWESQAEFEAAMLRLSRWVAEGTLSPKIDAVTGS